LTPLADTSNRSPPINYLYSFYRSDKGKLGENTSVDAVKRLVLCKKLNFTIAATDVSYYKNSVLQAKPVVDWML
jgi:hypothetical protein